MIGLEPGDREVVQAVRNYFGEDRSRMTMMAARKLGIPERAVVDALVGQWPIVPLRAGVVSRAGGVGGLSGTLEKPDARSSVRSRAAVIESVGVFGGFSEAGPFFNVQTDTLDMHILHEEIGSIYSIKKIGHDSTFETHSFQFFDRAGDAAFKAFLWEDYPKVPPARIATFHELTARFARGSGEGEGKIAWKLRRRDRSISSRACSPAPCSDGSPCIPG